MRCGRMVERWRCVSTNLLRLTSVSSSESPRHQCPHKVICILQEGRGIVEQNCSFCSPPLLSSPSPLLLPSLLPFFPPLPPPFTPPSYPSPPTFFPSSSPSLLPFLPSSSPSLLPFLPSSSLHSSLISFPSYLLPFFSFLSPLPSPSPQLTLTTFPSPKWLHASQGVVRCVSQLPYSTTPL